MPTIYSEEFTKSARSVEKTRANLRNNIETLLARATGTPEQAVAAMHARAAFVADNGSPGTAEKLVAKIPAMDKIKNLATLRADLGDAPDYAGQLTEIMALIDRSLPELDTDDRLFLKQDVLSLFTPDRQTGFCADAARLNGFLDTHAPNALRMEELTGAFAKHAGEYHVVVYTDPGTTNAQRALGESAPAAAKLFDMVTKLYDAVNDGIHERADRLEATREADRAARRMAQPAHPA